MRINSTPHHAKSVRPLTLRHLFTLVGGSTSPSIKALISIGLPLIQPTLTGRINIESQRGVNAGVGGRVVVGVAVVVDIRDVGRVATPRSTQPPVGTSAKRRHFTDVNPQLYLDIYKSNFCFNTLFCLRHAFSRPISLEIFS